MVSIAMDTTLQTYPRVRWRGNNDLPPPACVYGEVRIAQPLTFRLVVIVPPPAQTMRTAEEQFRQANDPNSGGGVGMDASSTAFGGVDDVEAGRGVRGSPPIGGAEEEEGAGTGPEGGRRRRRRGSSVMAPTILMRESSMLFRRASASFCRRLGEADGSLMNPDVTAFEVRFFAVDVRLFVFLYWGDSLLFVFREVI